MNFADHFSSDYLTYTNVEQNNKDMAHESVKQLSFVCLFGMLLYVLGKLVSASRDGTSAIKINTAQSVCCFFFHHARSLVPVSLDFTSVVHILLNGSVSAV